MAVWLKNMWFLTEITGITEEGRVLENFKGQAVLVIDRVFRVYFPIPL